MNVLIPAYVYTAMLFQDGAEKTGRFLQDRVERARRSDDRGVALSAEMVGLVAVVVALALILMKADFGGWIRNMIYSKLKELGNAK